jgi:hypothetical protein
MDKTHEKELVERMKEKYVMHRGAHSLDINIIVTGVDPGFSLKSAPTSPSYSPFQQHLRGRCSLTKRNYVGVAGQRCLQPEGM